MWIEYAATVYIITKGMKITRYVWRHFESHEKKQVSGYVERYKKWYIIKYICRQVEILLGKCVRRWKVVSFVKKKLDLRRIGG